MELVLETESMLFIRHRQTITRSGNVHADSSHDPNSADLEMNHAQASDSHYHLRTKGENNEK